MKYFVCVMNCLEDWHYNTLDGIPFSTENDAREYIHDHEFPTFSIHEEISKYFMTVDANGVTAIDKDILLECRQIVNIIPSEEEHEICNGMYCDDERAIWSSVREYLINCSGHVTWI